MSNTRNPERWLNGIIGPDTILIDGERVTVARKSLNFVGATQEDDPDNNATKVVIEAVPVPGPTLTNETEGTQHNVATDSGGQPAGAVRFTAAGLVQITGFAGGTDGRDLVVMAVPSGSEQTLLLIDENAGSAAANRIVTGTGADLTVPAGGGVMLKYDGSSTRWRVIGGAGGGDGGATPGGSAGDLQINLEGTALGPVTRADGTSPQDGDVARREAGVWRAKADVVELPDDLTAGDLLYFDGNDLARIPIGTAGQVLTLGLDLSIGWATPSGGGSGTFDPATLAWSGWWRAPYSNAAAWAGTASAGTSGSNSIDSAARPTAGTAVNGFTPAVFNGTTQYLTSGGEVDWIAHDQYTFVALVRLNAYGSGGAGGSEYNWPAIFQDSGGNWGIFVDASGIGLYHNDTAAGTKAIRANVALSTWVLVHGVWDGTNIKLYLNGVESASMAAINLNPAHADGEILNVGKSVGGATGFASMSLLELRLADFAMTTTQIANDKTYCNTRYALSL